MGKMNKLYRPLFLLILSIGFLRAFASDADQPEEKAKLVAPAIGDLKTLQTGTVTYKFRDLSIEIGESYIHQTNIKVRPVEDEVIDPNQKVFEETYAKAQIDVKRDGTIVDKLSISRMRVGGWPIAGLFVPKRQPLSDYFVISEHGSWDGHLILVDKTGKITNLKGGSYFITFDKHYLVGEYEAFDKRAGFLVFDLQNNHVLFQTKEKDWQNLGVIAQWYQDASGYFCTVDKSFGYSDPEVDTRWIYAFDFAKNSLSKEPARNRLKRAKKIEQAFLNEDESAVLVLKK